jgi:hypothetical protein
MLDRGAAPVGFRIHRSAIILMLFQAILNLLPPEKPAQWASGIPNVSTSVFLKKVS